MKKLILPFMIAIVGSLVAGCAPPAANTNVANTANVNANAAKPSAAAPTKEALLELDKKANEAWMKGDTAHFEGMLSDKFVRYMNGTRTGKADEIKMIAGTKCDVKSWSLDDAQMTKVSDDVYVNTYKSTFDGSCVMDGKTEKIPSPMRATSVWLRNGEKWQGVYHNEAVIIDPKAPPAPPAKSEATKEEPKKDDKAASNSNAGNAAATEPAKSTPSANTDALVKMHQAGWEAFKAKDANWFNEHIAANFGVVDPTGAYYGSKADAIKRWTETMKCEGITNVKVSDGSSTSITPSVEILTIKGTADGTCDGQKNGDLYQTAVYVKEGDAWKLAYLFEVPGM